MTRERLIRTLPLVGWLSRVQEFARRWLAFSDARQDLDVLIAGADPGAALDDRLTWLVELVRWIRSTRRLATEAPPEKTRKEIVRLRFVLNLLDRYPEAKLRVAQTLRSIIRDTHALDLFCETGLPRQLGILSEAADRLIRRILPQAPGGADLGAALELLFPGEGQAEWLVELDAETVLRLGALLNTEVAPAEEGWNSLLRDAEDALVVLATQLRAAGLAGPVRARIGAENIRALPFFGLHRVIERFSQARSSGNVQETVLAGRAVILGLEECEAATKSAYSHLGEFGVSVAIVYQLERIRAQAARAKALVSILTGATEDPTITAKLLAQLVADNAAQDSVLALVRQNFALLSQKIVERSAEIGEHYIARDRAEYGHMLKCAAGGGALTGITTTIKFGITGLHLPGFFEGLFASINYGLSFIGIQLLGFSLATKQPASTAPAIAAHMERLDAPGQLERLVDEIVHLIRSQVAGILGNVTFVIPATLVFELLARLLVGHPMISEEKAAATLGSLSALGPSWLYAAFTGILLWLSSTISGSVDNFFAYRGLSRALLKNRRLIFVFGARGAERISRFFTKNIAGFAANLSLGFFLGLLPALLQFVGIPLEVRHVTLATGSIAASVSALGVECLLSPSLWLAVLGVAGIGFLNVAVSFSVALLVAIRARAIAPPGRKRLYAAIRRRFRQEPGSFFYPPAPRRASLSPPV